MDTSRCDRNGAHSTLLFALHAFIRMRTSCSFQSSAAPLYSSLIVAAAGAAIAGMVYLAWPKYGSGGKGCGSNCKCGASCKCAPGQCKCGSGGSCCSSSTCSCKPGECKCGQGGADCGCAKGGKDCGCASGAACKCAPGKCNCKVGSCSNKA